MYNKTSSSAMVMLRNTASQIKNKERKKYSKKWKRIKKITDLSAAASTILKILFFPFSPFIAPLILNIPLKIDEKLKFCVMKEMRRKE